MWEVGGRAIAPPVVSNAVSNLPGPVVGKKNAKSARKPLHMLRLSMARCRSNPQVIINDSSNKGNNFRGWGAIMVCNYDRFFSKKCDPKPVTTLGF